MSATSACITPSTETSTADVPLTGAASYHLMAWLPRGIVGPKMATFVADQDAQILEIDENRARLRIGRKSWLPWRASSEDFALELTISLNPRTICARSATHLVAEMKSLVRNVSPEALRRRFGQVVRSLRYCLLAQELEAA